MIDISNTDRIIIEMQKERCKILGVQRSASGCIESECSVVPFRVTNDLPDIT